MGHYLSEMDPTWHERAEKRRQKTIKRRTKELKQLIKDHGLEQGIVEYVNRYGATHMRF